MALSASQIRRLVAQGMQQVPAGLQVSLQYVNVAPGDYDPATGLTADVVTTSPTFITPVVRPDEKEQASFPAPDKTQVVLVHYDQVQGKGLTPSKNDYFLVDGVRWEVIRIRGTPGNIYTRFYVETP
jgi:hypothetical protein